jgi:hypothetical protein
LSFPLFLACTAVAQAEHTAPSTTGSRPWRMEEQWWHCRMASCRHARSLWVSAPPSRSSASVPFEARRGATARWRFSLVWASSPTLPAQRRWSLPRDSGGDGGEEALVRPPPDRPITLGLGFGSFRNGFGSFLCFPLLGFDRSESNRILFFFPDLDPLTSNQAPVPLLVTVDHLG